MKKLLTLCLVLPVLLVACGASSSSRTKSTLAAAGFRMKVPETSEQRALYDALPAYEIHQGRYKGEVFYAYKDEGSGAAYVGNEKDYQRYQELAIQREIAQSQRDAAIMNERAATGWYGAYYRPYYGRPVMRPYY